MAHPTRSMARQRDGATRPPDASGGRRERGGGCGALDQAAHAIALHGLLWGSHSPSKGYRSPEWRPAAEEKQISMGHDQLSTWKDWRERRGSNPRPAVLEPASMSPTRQIEALGQVPRQTGGRRPGRRPASGHATTFSELYTVTIWKDWQGQRGSNPRPAVLETAALPTELYPFIPIIQRLDQSPQIAAERHGAPFKTTTADWQARFSIFKAILRICGRSALPSRQQYPFRPSHISANRALR